ncbi:TIGR03089 family protein [Pseudactinotalea sp. HY160]|uniref:TIGR03089 family protein n=1 Tax=Pseudactinotalea sp. HY160 TaxID=2654490 RepID=UPI00128E0F91|nr:TIGR03089 family protein [Pseudactinotalea sp. HY160]MPV48858.1 TIGR03089 family protein [Pseudactinotalea sp. HY160]
MITSLAGLAPLLAPVTEPRLTWYGPGGERVDLSGRVLANWFVKAANLCAQELDLGPGDRLGLDLPAHWRSLVWAAGAWICGAEVVPLGSDESGAADASLAAVVTATPPATAGDGPTCVVIALPAFALRLDDAPGPGAIDGVAELTSQPDQLLLPAGGSARESALPGRTQADVLAGDDPRLEGVRPGERALLVGADGDAARLPTLPTLPPLLALLTVAPPLWARGASIVLAGDPGADLDRIAAAEGVTTTLR